MKIKVSEDAKRIEALHGKTEPEVPEAIHEFVEFCGIEPWNPTREEVRNMIVEAYRRGKEGK